MNRPFAAPSFDGLDRPESPPGARASQSGIEEWHTACCPATDTRPSSRQSWSNRDCTLPGHPEVFAIGDMVSLNGLPGIAQPALQEGKYVGKVIRARLDGDTSVAPFKYFDKGTMATIGRTHAVARSGGMSFTGITAYLMWAFIHVLYLIGWGNRFGTLYSWGRSLWFTKNRAHRIITLDQAIDEIGVHGSAPADTTSSDIVHLTMARGNHQRRCE